MTDFIDDELEDDASIEAGFDPSPQQVDAMAAIERWYADANRNQVFRLFGYAGTGKTTLAIHVARRIGIDGVAFAAFTGKAALRMQQKGCKDAMTIHKLAYEVIDEMWNEKKGIYEPVFSNKGTAAKLIVIDECSMVDERIAKDLLAFGIPIIVIGDPGQLPPIGDKVKTGYFIDSDVFPLSTPDAMLTEVHRQKANSPILKLATFVRFGNRFKVGRASNADGSVEVVRASAFGDFDVGAWDGSGSYPNDATQVIAGTHRTRVGYNRKIRNILQRDEEPVRGDRVICCRNSPKLKIMNGEICEIVEDVTKSFDSNHWELVVKKCGVDPQTKKPYEPRACLAWNIPFHDETGKAMQKIPFRDQHDDQPFRLEAEEFDFAYAITCHKAQGSEWDNVVVFDESKVFVRPGQDHRREWAYTAVTRAAKRLLVVV